MRMCKRITVFIFLSLLVPSGISLAAQVINLVNPSTFNVAGNGSALVANYGEIKTNGYTYLTPSIYGGNDDSNNNTLNVNAMVDNNNISFYGGVNYPFSTSPVAFNATDVSIKADIFANNNTVNVSATTKVARIYGGYSVLSDAFSNIVPSKNTLYAPISMSGNSVNIYANDCEIFTVSGGQLIVNAKDNTYGVITFKSPTIQMNNNTVNISSSITLSDLFGANLSFFNKYKTVIDVPYISMSSNTVNISNELSIKSSYGNVSPSCIYVWIQSNDLLGSTTISSFTATNNKIVLSKSNLSINAKLHGCFINVPDGVIAFSDIHDNALCIDNAKSISVISIYRFDTFRIALPNDINNNDTILTLNNQDKDVVVDVNKLYISNYENNTSPLTLNLIDSYGSGSLKIMNTNGSYLYNTRSELKIIDKVLIFTFNPDIASSPVDPINPSPTPDLPILLDPQTITISQAGAANLAFAFQGLDLIMDEGLFSAKTQASNSGSNEPFFSLKGFSPFAACSAGKNKYFTNSTSHINFNGFSILAGLSKSLDISNHNLTIGAFFEHGNGKFETSNYFNYDPIDDFTVAGNGNSFYNGGGLLARVDLSNNIYFDASARFGNSSSNFFTSDLTKLSQFSFDYSTTYYGSHAGSGYILPINDIIGLDFSAKYFFTNLVGKTADLPENQSISFDTESISKFKLGSKLQVIDSFINTYLGVAFEYEPTNKVNATISNRPVDTPTLGGGVGIIESGFNTSYKNLGIDLSVAYADGKARTSLEGLLKFSYKI